MIRRGFTIVELIIVITILGILLTLAVVGLNDSQIKSRDSERTSDVETIGTYLESYFRDGSPISTTAVGTYPSTTLTSEANLKPSLPDADLKAFTAPGSDSPYTTFTAATNNNQTATGVTPQPTTQQYVYQPLRSDGTLCTSDSQQCRKYNLYYRLEADNKVYKYESRNR